MDAISRFLGTLSSAGARIRSEKSSAIITRWGHVPDEDELDYFSRKSRPDSTPPEKWVPGRQVQVITTNTPKPAEVPAAIKKPRPERGKAETLKKKRGRLLREIEALEGKLGKK